MKLDVVFFGEALPSEFHRIEQGTVHEAESDHCDGDQLERGAVLETTSPGGRTCTMGANQSRQGRGSWDPAVRCVYSWFV